MPRLTVLRFQAGPAERLMVEPLALVPRPPPTGARVAGELSVPHSTQIVGLSPPVLQVPAYGQVRLDDIVSGRVAVPGVSWVPARA